VNGGCYVIVCAPASGEREGLLDAGRYRRRRDPDRLADQLRIDLVGATAGIVNAGHPSPFRLRAGQVEQTTLEADVPFGLQPGCAYRVQALPLEVGDRLMFVTDGMLERDAAGMNIAAILTASMNMHAREAVQRLTQAVLQASGGQLRDDATALCLDWHGGPPRDRDATSGADRSRRADSGAGAERSL